MQQALGVPIPGLIAHERGNEENVADTLTAGESNQMYPSGTQQSDTPSGSEADDSGKDPDWVGVALQASGVNLGLEGEDSRVVVGTRTVVEVDTGASPPVHPLPFDVEVHQLPSGQRMVLDSHRLLVPDVAWIDWMRESEEARPRVWAVYTEPDGTSSREQWSFRTRIEWDRVAAPGSNDLELALLASHPIGDDVRPGSGSGSGSGVHFHSVRLVALHREAGIVLLRGLGENQEEVCSIVVSCPVWYFGNNPYLTCMLPPEASAVLAARSLP